MTAKRDENQTSHLTPAQVERFRKRKMTQEELLVVDQHIENCQECDRLLLSPHEKDTTLEGLNSFFGLGASHLSFEQKEALIHATLPIEEREKVDSHLQDCSECRDDVAALRATQADLAQPLLIAPPEAIPALAPTRSEQRTQAPRWGLALTFAGMGVVFLICAVFVRLQSIKTQETAQIRRLRQERDNAIAETETTRQRAVGQVADLQRQTEIWQRQVVQQDAQNQELVRKNREQAVTLQKAIPLGTPLDERRRLAIQQAQNSATMPFRRITSIEGGMQRLALVRGVQPFGPLSPIGTAVASNRPTLSWNPQEDSTGYEIVIRSLTSSKIVARTSRPILQTSWQTEQTLPRGQVYVWKVIALGKSGEKIVPRGDPSPRFQVMEQTALRIYVESRLALAALDVQDGLYEDAEAILNQIADVDAEDTLCRRAKQLLLSIQHQRAQSQP